jgi:hypothetical protein
MKLLKSLATKSNIQSHFEKAKDVNVAPHLILEGRFSNCSDLWELREEVEIICKKHNLDMKSELKVVGSNLCPSYQEYFGSMCISERQKQ